MVNKILKGNGLYWGWLSVLLLFMGAGAVSYLVQFNYGLGATTTRPLVESPS